MGLLVLLKDEKHNTENESNNNKQYHQQLQLNITNIAPHGNVDSKWNAIKDAFIDAGSKVLGHKRKTKKDWICTTTWEVIDERRRKKAAANSSRTRASKEAANRQYETLNKSVKRMCRHDKRMWISSIATQAETAAANGNTKMLYECTKRLSGRPINGNVPIKAKDGTILTSEVEQLSRWYEHFTELFQVPSENNDNLAEFVPHYAIQHINRVGSQCPSITEIESAIRSMKSGKAAGIDNVHVELFKAVNELSALALHELFQDIWTQKRFQTIGYKA
ncbi:uncharacterized protein [Musca autumnalis]|uniref:uncharacterized protein n=1 Tax=Musca autumnalis TaxID=221902 RepID=UPI003CE7E153